MGRSRTLWVELLIQDNEQARLKEAMHEIETLARALDMPAGYIASDSV